MEQAQHGLTRRSFLAGLAGAGALATVGLAGCAPKAAGEGTEGKGNAGSEGAAGAVADNSLVAVDNGSAAITVDWLGAPPEVAESDITETKDTDLLIVGAGNGGMIAGAYASDQKMDFILCEKGETVGATRHWFNAVDTKPFTDQGYHTDRARLHGEWARYSSGTCDHNLINMWMNESNDMFEYVDKYMSEAGAVVIADEFEMPGGMGATPFYTPCGEHHYGNAEGGRDGVPVRNELFEKVMNDNGYEISYKHELVKLVTEDSGKVTGAIFKTDNGYTQINAKKGVLLTTGGYSANPAMLSSLSPITTASVTALGYNQNNTGDGIKAALWAGAVKDITSATMIFDRGLVAPGTTAGYTEESVKAGNPQWPGNGQFNPGTQPFLKVNLRGERFALESADYDYLPHAAAQQPGGVYISVWDGNFGDDVQRFHTLGCSAGTRTGVLGVKKEDGTYDLDKYFEKELADGRLQKADTLDELADKLGFDADAKKTFLATCERYNELYDNQEDVDFGKEPYRLSELRTPPFFGATLGGTLLTTIDGVRINADCQALNADFEPIEGLYCAGDCSGSLFSGNYPDQMHGVACGRTMTEALHVVKHIAAM